MSFNGFVEEMVHARACIRERRSGVGWGERRLRERKEKEAGDRKRRRKTSRSFAHHLPNASLPSTWS